jgi:hypothetical protein
MFKASAHNKKVRRYRTDLVIKTKFLKNSLEKVPLRT